MTKKGNVKTIILIILSVKGWYYDFSISCISSEIMLTSKRNMTHKEIGPVTLALLILLVSIVYYLINPGSLSG